MNTPSHSTPPHQPVPHLSRGLLAILTMATGLAVANTYYNQPMLGLFIRDFHAEPHTVAIMPFLCQIGYAIGLFFVSPLGDRFERKRLILTTLFGLTLALAGAALAPTLFWLGVFSLCLGILTTVVQQLVPLSVHLAAPHERGKVLGTVTAGLLGGILLARTLSGYISDQLGWRSMFGIAAAVTLILIGILGITLPRVPSVMQMSYGQILVSLFGLWRRFRALRLAALNQAMMFACFSAFWTNLALEMRLQPYNMGATEVGLMGLVGAVGALAAPIAGRVADRRGPQAVATLAAFLVLISFVLFVAMPGSLVALIIGTVLMDLGVQSSLVSNQSSIYGLDLTARSRLNTVFMTTTFCGGAIGSAAGGYAFGMWGWTGTCSFAIACSAIALIITRIKRSS
ncbi:MAG: MFS transporter [Dongiaceae bacterium]